MLAGDRDKALEWLERAYQERDQGMVTLANAPVWDPLRSEPRFQDLIRRVSSLNGYIIRLAPGSRDLLATTMRAHNLAFIPMLTVERVRITGLDRILKTALDYGIAALLLAFTAPAILSLAAALRASGVRPFRLVRLVGREGDNFSSPTFNIGDLRYPVQRVIKRLGMERLPQLVSVLLGRMSIVGPRPVPADRRQHYAAWLPSLLTVKPGLTGTWAVRSTASLDEEMELSLFYIRNYTIWLDVEVLLRSTLRLVSTNGSRESEEGASLRERVPVHH